MQASVNPQQSLTRRIRRFFARSRVQEEGWAWLLLSPYILHLILFTAGPILVSLALSFTTYDLLRPPFWAGIDNYVEIFTKDYDSAAAFKNTGVFVLLYVPSSLIISLALAVALNQQIRGVAFFRMGFFLPVVAAGVATAVLWRFMYAREGILNWILGGVGIGPIKWLGFDMALNSIIIMSVWQGLGILMMYWLAGLQGVPVHLYEAARIDGAGRWSVFRHVTLPLLTPIVLFLTILGVIGTFQVFVSTFVITSGGPGNATLTMALLIYNRAFNYLRMGAAASLSWVMFVVVFTITMIQWKLQRFWVHYE